MQSYVSETSKKKSVDACSKATGLQHFVEKMSAVAFHVENHHGGPHWRHDRHFEPANLVFVDDIRDIAPQVVVAQAHGNHFSVGGVALDL